MISRRLAIKMGAGAGAALLLDGMLTRSGHAQGQLITKPVRSTGERIPVIGLGSSQTFNLAPGNPEYANAREVMRKALAWKSIVDDGRLQQQLTQGQATDARDKAKSNRESAQKAVRGAWSHILYPVKSDAAGKPFELEHSLISARDRAAIPSVVYDKAKADGIALEKLGTERLWLALKPIWPADRPHLSVGEVAVLLSLW